jgi:hypothetical protein
MNQFSYSCLRLRAMVTLDSLVDGKTDEECVRSDSKCENKPKISDAVGSLGYLRISKHSRTCPYSEERHASAQQRSERCVARSRQCMRCVEIPHYSRSESDRR